MERDFEVLVRTGKWLELTDDLRELPVARITCTLEDLVADLAARGLHELGFDWNWSYRHFVTAPDDSGRRYQAPFLVAFVADDGALTWTRHPGLETLRVSDVVRSRDEGVFVGDPFALLVEEPMGGDGLLPVWDDLVQLLVRLGEISAGLEATRRLAKRLLGILRDAQRQWELRGAMPQPLLSFILERPEWNHATLARYLQLSLATTVDLLECLGYVQGSSGTFVLTDPPSELRKRVEEDILHGDPRENRRWFWRVQGLERD